MQLTPPFLLLTLHLQLRVRLGGAFGGGVMFVPVVCPALAHLQASPVCPQLHRGKVDLHSVRTD